MCRIDDGRFWLAGDCLFRALAGFHDLYSEAMGDFRTYKHAKRPPAKAMEPVVASTAWTPQDLRDVASWSYRLSEEDRAELIEAVRNNRVAVEDVSRDNFRLFGLEKILRRCRFLAFPDDYLA